MKEKFVTHNSTEDGTHDTPHRATWVTCREKKREELGQRFFTMVARSSQMEMLFLSGKKQNMYVEASG